MFNQALQEAFCAACDSLNAYKIVIEGKDFTNAALVLQCLIQEGKLKSC
jgi:hypothetical protein